MRDEPEGSRVLAALFHEARTFSHWQPRPVSEALIEAAFDLACLGPTSGNCQPMRLALVHSPAAKERLLPCVSSGNYEKVRTAPITAIVAYDREFYELLPRLYPHTDARGWFTMNSALAEATGLRNSSLQGAPSWLVYTNAERATMILDTACALWQWCAIPTASRGFSPAASSRTMPDGRSASALGEEAVLGARQPEILAQRLAFVFAAEEVTALELRHHLVDEVVEAARHIGEHDVEPVAGLAVEPLLHLVGSHRRSADERQPAIAAGDLRQLADRQILAPRALDDSFAAALAGVALGDLRQGAVEIEVRRVMA